VWRGGITKAEDFFNRETESRIVNSYLQKQQNCQVIGPRRIGKTSLLREIQRAATKWGTNAVVAYLDLQDPRFHTIPGLINQVARQCSWPNPVSTLIDFAERVEAVLLNGVHPVLCLDEFEELVSRREEFGREFFLTLRSCGEAGMSIITVSGRPLSELTEPGDPTSPFYNTFPILRLGRFNDVDAHDFVNLYRPGVPAFKAAEKQAILEFAKGHPLALQVGCFYVLEAKKSGESLLIAIRKAEEEINALLPKGL
jgi:hypothetical protein